MKNYLFTISEEEKNNILDKHKNVYNGYATNQISPNTQPLYVQDFANDKGGITVKNDGSVSSYNNKIYMKEEKGYCSECGLNEELCECGSMNEAECSECGGMMKEGKCSECGYKTTGKFGKNFDYVEEDEKSDEMLDKLSDEMEDEINVFDDSEIEEDECNECGGTYEEEWKEEVEYEEDIDKIEESINESLNWFNRFKKYN